MKAFPLFFLVLLVLGCQNEQESTTSNQDQEEDIEWIDPNNIQQGPIVHDSLSSEQIEKIEFLHETFQEVDSTSLDKWIEDFKRDFNPDEEINIWMAMATAYNDFCDTHELTLDTKNEVYMVLLMRSSVEEDVVLESIELKHLSEEEAKEVMSGYTLEPDPIEVISE